MKNLIEALGYYTWYNWVLQLGIYSGCSDNFLWLSSVPPGSCRTVP